MKFQQYNCIVFHNIEEIIWENRHSRKKHKQWSQWSFSPSILRCNTYSKELFTYSGSQEPGDSEALCQCQKTDYSQSQTVNMCVEVQFRLCPEETEPVTTSLPCL